ncbi:hypothetical protein [Anaerotignum sp. MB30-C6]|uniref:hypothetical protein n=1 Tax=Anaerotignum sp. MB30-C6 TaxID=3070814 RepID=UPI0027DDB8AC|nr:hypothetical protein [Anaerotignum sp. MB30-C6]WMI81132.1 hypothetical protein RBQ60_15195 [Anaerotignum sp. MB30-C6]
MNMDLELLQSLPLFRKISTQGLETMMDCFCGELISLKKGERLWGEKDKAVCLIGGEVENLKKGHLAPMPRKDSPSSVKEDSVVLVMENHMLLYPCYGCCFFHAQLLENMREDGIDFKGLES